MAEARQRMMMKRQSSLSIALMASASKSHDEDDANVDIPLTKVAAKELISKYNTIINEHAQAARALSYDDGTGIKAVPGREKAAQIKQLIAERKKANAGKPRPGLPLASVPENKIPEVTLRKVEVTEKPKRDSNSAAPTVRLQHIVRNASSNIEYSDFMNFDDEDEFEVQDINSQLRPSSMQFFRSVSTLQQIKFCEENDGISQEEFIKKILKEGFGDSNDEQSEPCSPARTQSNTVTEGQAADGIISNGIASTDSAAGDELIPSEPVSAMGD